MRVIAWVACLSIVLTGCGDGEPTLAEYAEQVEALTTDLYETTDRLSAEIQAKAVPPALPPAEDLHDAYRALADAFRDLSEGLGDVEPPPDIAEMHGALLGMAARLTATNDALSAKVDEYRDGDDWDALMATPEARAAQDAEDEIVSFCQERQAELDATATREGLSDAPWIPAEMQEVILVAFGCDR